jgi:hypothetical protein
VKSDPKMPKPEDLDVAAQWLRVNEGENGEAESCRRVARWLEKLVRDADERRVAKEGGVSVRTLRSVMERNGTRQEIES